MTHHRLNADESAHRSTDEGDEAVEDGDGGRDDVGEQNAAYDRREPDNPVLDGVARQVVGPSEDSNEDVLGRELA